MADGANPSIKSRMSEAEWQARVDLAALYRLVALHGWDGHDLHPHLGARAGTGASFPDQSLRLLFRRDHRLVRW